MCSTEHFFTKGNMCPITAKGLQLEEDDSWAFFLIHFVNLSFYLYSIPDSDLFEVAQLTICDELE